MQNHFIGPIIGTSALKKLASLLESELKKNERIVVNTEKLSSIYTKSGLAIRNFDRVTSLLEKIAILLPITDQR